MVTAIRDISARQRAQAELQKSEAAFRGLLDGSSIGIFIRQGDRAVYANEAYARLYGYGGSQEILELESVRALEAPAERQRFQSFRAQREQGSEVPDTYEFEGLRKDGSSIWLENHVQPISWYDEPSLLVMAADISDRRQAQEAMEIGEQRFRNSLEGLIQGVAIFVNNKPVFANPAMAKILGYDGPDDILCMDSGDDFLHPDEIERINHYRRTRLQGQAAPDTYEVRAVRGDDTTVWLESRAAVIDWGGESAILGSYIDISDRKRAEEALRHSESMLRDSQRIAHIGSWERDLRTDEVNWSEEMYRIFGMEPNSVPANYDLYLSRIHPDDRDFEMRSHSEALARGQPLENKVRLVLPNGERRVIRHQGETAFDEYGNRLHFSGTAQDITEMEKAERALRVLNEELEERVQDRTNELRHELKQRERTQIALQQSEERQRAIMDSAVDGIIVINQKGIIESFSHSATEMFGYASSEVIGKNISMLMPAPYRSHHDGYLRKYLAGGQPQVIGRGREVRGRRKDGSIFPMEIGVSEVDLGDYRVFTGVVRNISERKRVEQELLLARKAAESANQAKSEFLSSMSHELRTPLNAVLGFGQLLRDYPDQQLTDEQRAHVEQILDGGQHLLGLVNEVLDLARIESGQLALSVESVDLAQTLRESLMLVQPLADERDIAIMVEADIASATTVMADPSRLKQVLLNVLSNAVKYNRDNGTVRLDAAATGSGMMRINVSDTGPGIPAQKRDEVFRPFSRLDVDAKKIEGTGIGLTITRELIESMGGKIDFESSVGEGSTFWIEIPIAEPQPSSQTGA